MIRPEAQAALHRWQAVLLAAAGGLAGLWLAGRGGWLLMAVGLAVVALSLASGILALRRLRFAQAARAPGLVEVDEGQISYFGPQSGGAVSLRELVELRLLARGGQRYWRLKQQDGQALLVPVDAMGAERLFDAFSALPGMDSAALIAALNPADPAAPAAPTGVPRLPQDELGPVIWRGKRQAALT